MNAATTAAAMRHVTLPNRIIIGVFLLVDKAVSSRPGPTSDTIVNRRRSGLSDLHLACDGLTVYPSPWKLCTEHKHLM
jgi:hypothetical protein